MVVAFAPGPVRESGAPVCEHARRYYQEESDNPTIFWPFPANILPPCHRLEQENSTTGDICHYNILGLSKRRARAFFKGFCVQPDDLRICEDSTHRPFLREDVEG